MLDVEESRTYSRWFGQLRDLMAKARINKYLMRVQMAGKLMGDWKHVGDGVIETRHDFGPGYRVYLSIEGNKVLLLLAGGEKHGQQRDIQRAKDILKEWRSAHGRGIQ